MDRTASPRGVLPIMAYSGEAPTERGAFFRLQVFGKVRDLPNSSTWKGREICHFGRQKDSKGQAHAFHGCEKVKKTFWFCDLFKF